MTANRVGLMCLSMYFAAFIITFGHAAANKVCREASYQPCDEQRVGAGIAAGTFWPLYWSLTVFAKGAAE